jgi:hypothetical protein
MNTRVRHGQWVMDNREWVYERRGRKRRKWKKTALFMFEKKKKEWEDFFFPFSFPTPSSQVHTPWHIVTTNTVDNKWVTPNASSSLFFCSTTKTGRWGCCSAATQTNKPAPVHSVMKKKKKDQTVLFALGSFFYDPLIAFFLSDYLTTTGMNNVLKHRGTRSYTSF